jgi:hypothetical protein
MTLCTAPNIYQKLIEESISYKHRAQMGHPNFHMYLPMFIAINCLNKINNVMRTDFGGEA